MAVIVVKGQKADLTKTNPGLTHVNVGIGWGSPASLELDTSAFLLGPGGKVSGDEDLIFYNNPTTPFITYSDGQQSGDKKQFALDLTRIPANIEKIAFTLTIYDADQKRQNFGQVQGGFIRFAHPVSGEVLRFNLDSGFTVETAIVIGELYRHNGEWKFNAIGAGFSGGLDALCVNFGIEVENNPSPPTPVPTPPSPAPRPAPTPPPVPPAPKPEPSATPVNLNLRKIELKKKGDTINLKKGSGGLGEILINLNWNQVQQSKGFFNRGSKGVDLDLGCLYEMKNGDKGVVQALGEVFGSLNRFPYIALDGDDRTGSVKTGENLRINGAKISEIKRILVFTFIYEGVTNWSQADGVVTLYQKDGPDIIVHMNEHDNRKGMCAIAMIQNVNDETFSIERLVQFYGGHRELDRAYNWGMRWSQGSK
ncbi:TerD family protein [Paenibacillus sp. FSL L8-0158]|uniref:TerD family protein n=1 Tax=Paenibacillus sp. FSL L8-0158 TaxID=2954752 RepID=UPI00315934FD